MASFLNSEDKSVALIVIRKLCESFVQNSSSAACFWFCGWALISYRIMENNIASG